MTRWILAVLAVSVTCLASGCWHRHGLCRDKCDDRFDDRYYLPR
jgi:hypothetical protein